MIPIRCFFFGVLAVSAVFGQAAAPRPEFEVASIKPVPPGRQSMLNVGLHIDGAQVRCSYFALKDYIAMAYRVKYFQVSGPEWLGSTRFDIAAKLAPDAHREKIPEMFQALLENRFQMKMHREMKDFPVYGLVVTKGGLKLKESPPDAEDAPSGPGEAAGRDGGVSVTASGSRDGVSLKLGKASFSIGNNRLEGKKMTMASLAEMLTRFEDRPVIDMTQASGMYDFQIECTPEDFRAMMVRSAIAAGVNLPPEAMRALEGVSGDSLFAALQAVGLKLEPRKAPIEVLVIDRMEKEPTEN